MEDFIVTCQLVLCTPHLISGSCSSPRAFGLGFLQTPPHDDALALLLAFGSVYTWREDSHLASSVPCLAHTAGISRARSASAWMPLLAVYFGFYSSLSKCFNCADSTFKLLFTE